METKVKIRRVELRDAELFKSEKKLADQEGREFAYKYDPNKSFEEYITFVRNLESGNNLAKGDVAGTTFIVENEQCEAVGTCSVRHELNDFLRNIGGHIGYTIFNRFRRRGYGKATLRECLKFAKEKLGIKKALLTCDEDNTPSRKIIEKCGGVFEGVYDGPKCPTVKRRYWIHI